MAKSVEPQQLQNQHWCKTSVPCFERFQTNCPSIFQSNQSIAPINISCPLTIKVSASNSPVTPKSLFSAARIERDWVHFWLYFQFYVLSGRFEEKSPAQRKCRQVNENEYDEECHYLDWRSASVCTNTSGKISVTECTAYRPPARLIRIDYWSRIYLIHLIYLNTLTSSQHVFGEASVFKKS